jgi:predicted membrane channel-forming protein YqfA (hemolysin III family)
MREIFCLIAGWLVPGLGHVLQKKFWRGAIFFVSIGALTAIGLSMGGRIYPFQTENPLTILAFFADLGNFVVYALARVFAFGQGSLERVTFEFGTAYIAGAGLLNYLIAIDAYDIAKGKKK